jgi:hypothetical protein
LSQTIKDYANHTDDDLYGLLGARLLGAALGMSPEEEDDQQQFGRQWFARQYEELQRRICTAGVLRTTGTNVSDRIVDAFAIQQILQEHEDYAVNAVLLAVLVSRIGLGTFCAGVGPGA